MSFPCSEKSLSISGFPGLWPPCHTDNEACNTSRRFSFLSCLRLKGTSFFLQRRQTRSNWVTTLVRQQWTVHVLTNFSFISRLKVIFFTVMYATRAVQCRHNISESLRDTWHYTNCFRLDLVRLLDHFITSFHQLFSFFLSPTSEQSEWWRYCFRSMYVYVYVCACVQPSAQSDQFKMVKATDFKFEVHVPKESPDMTP